MIGKLNRIDLRNTWRNETDFSKWLLENIEIINETLDMTLSNPERERAVGDFSIDLTAEDEAGNPVIIEIQLEKSNHEHLGKLVTYMSGIGAKVAIWIVSDPREEHKKAISWLNESRAASFYLLKIEAVQIQDSPPAPLLTLIAGPSEEGQQAGEIKEDLAERYVIRKKFWTSLLEKAKAKTKLHSTISPNQYSWIGTSAGKSGLNFNYVISKHESHVEIYIDRGKESDKENKEIFDILESSKNQIETIFGEPLEWQRLEGRRACRIKKQFSIGGYRDEEKWDKIQDAMIDAMIRLEKAFRPYIDKLKV